MITKNLLTLSLAALIIISPGCNLFRKVQPKSPPLSSVAPTLPAPPQFATAPKGTPEQQAIYFADQIALPENRLAGWLGLYDALRIPIIGQDGKSVGTTGDDPIGPRYWQVWYSSGLDKKGRGIPLSDAGRLLGTGTPEVDGAALGQVLLDDLRHSLKSTNPQVRLMGEFVRVRIKRWPSHLDISDPSVTPRTAIIDLPTVQAIHWMTMRGVLFENAANSRASMSPVVPPATFVMAMYQSGSANPASQLPCSEKMGDADSTYWTSWLTNKVIGGGVLLPGMKEENAFKGLIENFQNVDQASKATIEKTNAAITNMNILAVSLSLLLQLAAMEIEPRQIPAPLKRTHHTSRGEDGKIELQLYSAPDKIPNGDQLGACVGAFLANAFGVSFSFPPKGPISGAEMNVSGGEGFTNLVLFNSEGTNSMRRWTDKNGVAEYKLFGAPQKQEIPLSAKEVKKEFSVHVTAQPEEAGLNSMLNIFFGGLTFGANPTKAGGFGSVIDILKGFQYDMGEYFFDLTDWQQQGYRASGRNGDIVFSGVICSLDKPFTVDATWLTPIAMKFDPRAGTWAFGVKYQMLKYDGSGTYTIQGAETGNPHILRHGTEILTHPYGNKTTQGSDGIIQLVPLETGECDGK